MPDFIHLWNARHGVPDSGDSAVETSNRLAGLQESGTLLPLIELIETVLKRHPIVSIQPATPLVIDEDSGDEGADEQEPVDPLWHTAPNAAYERFRPAVLRLGLADSALHFFPCAYEILKFCKTRGIVAIEADAFSPTYWQPDGFLKKHNSVVANSGSDRLDSLASVLEPPAKRTTSGRIATRSPSTQSLWPTVAGGLEEVLLSHGMKPFMTIAGAHNGQLVSGFSRKVPAGMQAINWRMARLPAEDDDRAELCVRMSIKMKIDILPDTLYGVMKQYNLAETSAINCELSEFLAPPRFDLGRFFMANRNEWGPDSDTVSIEDPKNRARVLAALKNHAIPFLNRCDTVRNTLHALRSSKYPFVKRPPLVQLVLAWHVQDLDLYDELKHAFLREAADGRFGTDPQEAVALLESTHPAFKD